MRQQKINEILTILRKEKRIAQHELCKGLCDQSVYSRIEYGERIPDRLLINALLQRLGKASDKLSMILNIEEYQYFLWKKQVLTCAGEQNINTLEELLNKKEAVEIIINEKLQKQFLYTMRAIVAEHKEKNLKKSIALLEQAIELTLPELKANNIQEYLMSIEEMQVVLERARLLLQLECREEDLHLLLEIVEYIEKNYDDYEAKVKIYPKAIKLLYPLLLQYGREQEARDYCKKAIDLLRWNGILYDLTDLMEGYLICSTNLPPTEEVIRYKKQLQALKEVYTEYHAVEFGIANAHLSYTNQELYLVNELIQRNRLGKALSQETISDGICSPETLSRIECGKRSPSMHNFQAIMEKLDTKLEYYNGTLDTSDFLLLEKKKELDRALSLKKWDEARRLLKYLKQKIDMNNDKNQQELKHAEYSIQFWSGELTPESYITLCEKDLECEQKEWKRQKFWQKFFTKDTIELLNSIVVAYARLGKYEESIFISEHLLEFLESSNIQLSNRYKSCMTVVGNLSSFYGEIGELDKCVNMCELGMKLCLESGRGVRISKFLGNKAEAVNLLANKPLETCKKFFEQSYYISDFMDYHESRDYIDNYYRSNYDANVVWY